MRLPATPIGAAIAGAAFQTRLARSSGSSARRTIRIGRIRKPVAIVVHAILARGTGNLLCRRRAAVELAVARILLRFAQQVAAACRTYRRRNATVPSAGAARIGTGHAVLDGPVAAAIPPAGLAAQQAVAVRGTVDAVLTIGGLADVIAAGSAWSVRTVRQAVVTILARLAHSVVVARCAQVARLVTAQSGTRI